MYIKERDTLLKKNLHIEQTLLFFYFLFIFFRLDQELVSSFFLISPPLPFP